ncbi:MAG: aldo/keto reductase [Tumebacillaceae bacterium]
MIKHITDSAVLTNGVKMPYFGLGVWRTKEGEEVINSVLYALKAGYRHIDTAAVYGNEEGVGQAIRESGVKREELFVTTKVWNENQRQGNVREACEDSLKKLGLDYVDLYLIHWPVAGKYKETWKEMEKLYKEGKVRAIGVSNFHVHHLQDLLADCEIKPMVNQVEFHPYLTQNELRAFCREQGIQFEAWSPLMQGDFLNEPVITEMAAKYGRAASQIVLRWDLQHEVVTIPKSVKEARIIENANIFDFELSAEDVAKLDALNKGHRYGPDPDNFDF